MLEVIREPDEIASLANAWNKLAERFRNPLLQNEWFSACAKVFCRPGQLHVFINNTPGGLSAVAPLMLTRNRLIKRFELLGSSFLGEPGGFIYKDKESLQDLIGSILKMGRPLILPRTPAQSTGVFEHQQMDKKLGALPVF